MTNHNKSGIYWIRNFTTGKYYVGSAVYFFDRWSNHRYRLRRNKHGNRYLQAAWNKYGEEDFEFKVLQYVSDLNKLLEVEQAWLNWTDCCNRKRGYNLFSIAGSAIGTKWTEERKIKHSRLMKNFKHTEESKLKMKGRKKTEGELAALRKPRGPVSEETKEKIRLANSGKTRNAKPDKWPHGSKCLCGQCKLIRNNYLYLQRNGRLDLWYA